MSMNSDHQEVCESFDLDEHATVEQSCTDNVIHHAVDIDEVILDCEEYQPPSRTKKLMYGVDESPFPLLWPLFGLQQVMACAGGVLAMPLLTVAIICVDGLPEVTSQLINHSLLSCGIATILQNVLGIRLPIIQGASPHFLASIISMMAVSEKQCSSGTSDSISTANRTSNHDWVLVVREIQGNLMLASLTQVFLGMTGLVGVLLRFMGPLTITPTISLIGFSLAPLLSEMCASHWAVSSATTLLLLIFGLFLGRYELPLPICARGGKCRIIRYPLFQVAPVLLSIIIMWIVCFALTQANVFSSNTTDPAYQARTDTRLYVVSDAPWFYFPYPGHFGTPIISVAGYVGMLAATIASIIESIGDYYTVARVSDCPSPPAHAVNRGIAMEGLGSLIAGSLGAVHGVTSYSENIGAIVFTKVASRPVFVTAGVMLTLCGVVGKFGAVVTLIPAPIIGGVATVTFGMVAAVGLSTLQFVDMSSCRNLMVLALAMILGLAIPHWVRTHPGAIQTGSQYLDHVLSVVLGSPMLVGCIVGFILDNMAPGTPEERGVLNWRRQVSDTDTTETTVYELPLISRYLRKTGRCTKLPVSPTYTETLSACFSGERCGK